MSKKFQKSIECLFVGKRISNSSLENLHIFNNSQDDFEIIFRSNNDKLYSHKSITEGRIQIDMILPEDNINNDIFYCLKDDDRLNFFKDIISGDADIFWCFNAGKGTTNLIMMINDGEIDIPREKIIIGFSDDTALGIFLSKKYGWKMLHAPILSQVVDNYLSISAKNELIKSIKSLVNGDVLNVNYDLEVLYITDDIRNAILYNPIRTAIVGGNATIIEMSIGTDWEIETKGKIFFFEDICLNGAGYMLERTVVHMINAHLFDGVKAVIIGCLKFDSSDIQERDMKFRIIDLLLKHNSSLEYPIFSLEMVGHMPDNMPLPLYSDDSAITLVSEGINSDMYNVSANIFI